MGPVDAETLRAMRASGDLQPNDLVWREGLSDWTPISSQPELAAPLEPSAAPVEQPPPIGMPPNLGGWLRFVGIMSILAGIMYCASCFGILWGVLLIIGGVALLGARRSLEGIPSIPPSFIPFMEKLHTFFLVTGITYIIMLVGFVLVMIFYGGILIAAIAANWP